jgi:hypothetical protein
MGSPMRAPATVIQPVQEVIACEGFLDIIKQVFGGKRAKMDPKTHREHINQAFYKGAAHVKSYIAQTFANRDWVESHYKPEAHHVNIRDWHYLAFQGKMHQPKEVLDHFSRGFLDAQRKYDGVGQIEKYVKELDEAEEAIEAFYQIHDDDVDAVENFARTQMQQIEVPPKMNWNERHSSMHQAPKEVQALPTLTTNQVIEAANEILKVMDIVKKYEGAVWNSMPGSGCDAHEFWGENESTGYDGEQLRTGDVGDFFYFQSTPDEVCATVSVPFSDLQDSILAVCAWLILTCPD